MMNENNNGNGGCSKNPPKPRRIVISFFSLKKNGNRNILFPRFLHLFVFRSLFLFCLVLERRGDSELFPQRTVQNSKKNIFGKSMKIT